MTPSLPETFATAPTGTIDGDSGVGPALAVRRGEGPPRVAGADRRCRVGSRSGGILTVVLIQFPHGAQFIFRRNVNAVTAFFGGQHGTHFHGGQRQRISFGQFTILGETNPDRTFLLIGIVQCVWCFQKNRDIPYMGSVA